MREEMIEVAHAHAAAEGSQGDLETTLATLEPNPVYELQPGGRLLRGMDAVRSYYEFFRQLPTAGGVLRSPQRMDNG